MSARTTHKPTAPAATVDRPPPLALEPTEDQIRARAYELFVARNGVNGDAQSDWLQAEHELRARAQLNAETKGAEPLFAAPHPCATIGTRQAERELQPV